MSIAIDKQLHFWAGVTIGAGFAGGAWALGSDAGAMVGVGAALCAGMAKESWDWARNRRDARSGRRPTHSVELEDIGFTLVGGVAGSMAIAAIKSIFS